MTLQTEPDTEATAEGFANPPRTHPEAHPKHDPEVPGWVAGLIALDYQKGTFSQEAIAKIIGKSSAAVRQVIKAIQQHVPRHALITDDGITELGKTLILRSQSRGSMSMPRWTAQLGKWLGAIPETRQWEPLTADDTEFARQAEAESKEKFSAIELRITSKLDAFKSRHSSAIAASDDLSEADVALKAKESYELRLDMRIAQYEAERKADEDFERMIREMEG